MGKRRLSRRAALQFLYQVDSVPGGRPPEPGDVARDFRAFCSAHHRSAGRDVLGFALELCRGTLGNLDAIDGLIDGCSDNWKVSRMSPVDRNVLRLSVYEMVFLSDIPLPVSINEAVEVAREFGSESSGAFVNGILDRLGEDVRKDVPGSDN